MDDDTARWTDEPAVGPRFTPPERPRSGPRARPAFGAVVGVAIALRLGREVAERAAFSRYGLAGVAVLAAVLVAVVLAWRANQRARARRQGGAELTPEAIRAQVDASGLGSPAFPEDGTLLGASVLVVNQRTKVLEAVTEYEVFDASGRTQGSFRQIAQSRLKLAARLLTAFDQFFTHHFELIDLAGRPVLRMTRPRKLFLSKIHVFDGTDRFLGTIQQLNVLWKIRFELRAANGQVVGFLRAQNLRAWDFHVYDWHERVVASVVKSWEGWARTVLTRADRYVLRVHEPLADPLRQLTLAAALAADVALKQDARGLG